MKYPEIDNSISFRRLRIFIGGLAIALAGLVGGKKSVDWAHKVIVYGEEFYCLEKRGMTVRRWMKRRQEQ
ncbi:hypothetical protein [Xenorhabdus sp. BG5]|uniref:hypothetical protein n=1 Tax=Xenorhabdus sp. BG5 TaxID=2782014 RepID=UPI00187E94FA|nr:hypothetical protein [Xenorhabdus sp. BG5]MBE8598099.1 hypothetical protein [Xenorhabdus sp. BG5]